MGLSFSTEAEAVGRYLNLVGGTIAFDSGTLRGVTFDGTLDLSAEETSVYLANGTVVNDAAGTGPGTINDTGDGSYRFFRQHADVQQRDDQSRQHVVL